MTQNWITCSVRDVAAPVKNALVGGPFGSNLVSKDYVESGIPVIRGQNMGERWVNGEFAFVSEEKAKQLSPNTARPGDLIFTQRGTIGQVSIVPEKPYARYIVSQSQMKLTVDKAKADAQFLYYYFSTPEQKGYITRNAIQTGVPHTNLEHLRSTPLTLPPLSEQCAITEILGALDDKIELNRRMNGTLESLARAVFRQWLVENEDVGEWETVVLNDLADSILGGDWGKDTSEDGTLLPAFCIRGADIPDLQSGGIGKMPLRYIKPSSLEKRKLQTGDIVVEISGGSPTQSTGRPVFISDTLLNRFQYPIVASNFCRVFRPKDTVVSNFVYFWLRFLYSRDEFFQYENGTTGIKNFAFTIFCEQYSLCLPPQKLLEKYHQLTNVILEAMQSNAKQSRTLASLRDSLLPKLMRGEVRVKG